MLQAGPTPIAALDANVLFGYPLRDTLLYAVDADMYRPVWSDEIWDEVLRNLTDPRRKRPHTEHDARRLMDAIRRSFPDAFVDGYQPLVGSMPVDPKDRHVTAVAVLSGASVLVTYNLRHFPEEALGRYGIDVRHPDTFLHDLYLRDPPAMVGVVRDQAAPLAHPPRTPHQILDALERAGIARFASAIRSHL